MATLDDLETALRVSWDRDTAAVYADHLLSLGDGRGELISIDLRIEDAGPTPELVARRREILESWLGSELPNGTIRHGFVDVDATSADPAAQARVAFNGPAELFIRSVTMVGPPSLVAEALAVVTAVARPSLTSVAIRQWPESTVAGTRTQPKREVAAVSNYGLSFAAATPNLTALEVEGRQVFTHARLAHPNVRRLRVSGHDAIPLDELAGLVELDLALQFHLDDAPRPPSNEALAQRLSRERLPALVHLDLSRNEPGRFDPHNLGGEVNVFLLLRQLAIRSQLVTLRLPSLGSRADVTNLQLALEAMPALRELEIVRVRPKLEKLGRELSHPAATIRLGPP